jgi:hypothetical protein
LKEKAEFIKDLEKMMIHEEDAKLRMEEARASTTAVQAGI